MECLRSPPSAAGVLVSGKKRPPLLTVNPARARSPVQNAVPNNACPSLIYSTSPRRWKIRTLIKGHTHTGTPSKAIYVRRHDNSVSVATAAASSSDVVTAAGPGAEKTLRTLRVKY